MTELVSLSAEDARTLTDRIKVGVETLWDMIKQAYREHAWAALGYDSWDDYCTTEFNTSHLRLPREERAEVVASMRDIGMSIREIASATGEGRDTVHRELSDVRNRTGFCELSGSEPVDAEIVYDEPVSTPSKPRRSPITDLARNAGWELRKAVERIERISVDDRFVSQMETVTPHLRGHLTNAIEVCQDLLDRINTRKVTKP